MNRSKLAQHGDSSTVSPLEANERAEAMASDIEWVSDMLATLSVKKSSSLVLSLPIHTMAFTLLFTKSAISL